jgi:hypothetical protein
MTECCERYGTRYLLRLATYSYWAWIIFAVGVMDGMTIIVVTIALSMRKLYGYHDKWANEYRRLFLELQLVRFFGWERFFLVPPIGHHTYPLPITNPSGDNRFRSAAAA